MAQDYENTLLLTNNKHRVRNIDVLLFLMISKLFMFLATHVKPHVFFATDFTAAQ